MNEASENHYYRNVITNSLKQGNSFCPMRREKQMDYLFTVLSEDFREKGLEVLDACCGYGRLIYFLKEFDSEQKYTGIDYLQELVDKGRDNFEGINGVEFVCQDMLELPESYYKKFDITINYKTLSWLPYYKGIIAKLFAATRKKIYITSLFHDGDIDFITKIFTEATSNDSENFTFLNTYSLPKFTKYCLSLGAKEVKVTDMMLDFDLPVPSTHDTLQTYTILTNSGNRLEITGNVILNWKLVEVVLV